MGGFGSGRQFGANCTEDYRAIDSRLWQRKGGLVPGCCVDWTWSRHGESIATIRAKVEVGQVRLQYNYRKDGDDWEALDYPVTLVTTPCHYGGVRYWFSCPAMGCGKRVALLYLGDRYFACRKCYQLAYRSQRETTDDRGFRGASKIRDKLSWEPGIANPNGEKPKNMHCKTYHRLINAHDGYADQAMQGIYKKILVMTDQFSG